MNYNLKKRAVFGALLLVFKRVFVQFVHSVSNIFLARLLFPADFGVFAIVIFITSIFSVFTDLSIASYIIQRKELLDEDDLQTAFTIQSIMCFTVIILILLTAPILSNLLNLGDIGIKLLRFYALIFAFVPFKTVAAALLERELMYKKIVFIEAIEVSSSSIVSVILAFLGFGVTSFAVGGLSSYFIGALLYYYFSAWKIRFRIVRRKLESLLSFGLPLQSNSFFGVFYGPLVLLYMGKAVGSEGVGYFQFAAGLSTLPIAFSEIVNRVVLPLSSRGQEDKSFLKDITEKSIMIVSVTSLPAAFLMIMAAPSLIHYLYTDKWLPALPSLYLGLLQMAIISFTGVFTQLLISQGEVKSIRNIGFFWVILTWVLVIPLVGKFGFVGMNLTSLIVSISGLWLFFKLKRLINFSFKRNFLPFLLAAFVSSAVFSLLLTVLPESLIGLFIALTLAGLVYLTLVVSIKGKELNKTLGSFLAVFKQV